MQEILENISVLITEDEFNSGVGQDYPIKVIYANDGKVYEHRELTGGRFVRVEKKPDPEVKSSIKPEMDFLPGGKIPMVIFDQLMEFFRQAMVLTKGTQLEAMAYVHWNPREGYFVSIPDQTVSKASANCDFSALPEDEVIVLDWHSHNSMGAFFSGTDNDDDTTYVKFSGVVGKLDTPNPEFKWRFNFYSQKIDVSMSDIFDTPKVQVPKSWIDKVSIRKPKPVSTRSPAGTGAFYPPEDYKEELRYAGSDSFKMQGDFRHTQVDSIPNTPDLRRGLFDYDTPVRDINERDVYDFISENEGEDALLMELLYATVEALSLEKYNEVTRKKLGDL